MTVHQGEIEWDSSKPDGTPRKLMDISKMHELGWKHQLNLEEGIQLTYNWFLENVNLFKILCPHKYGDYKDCHNFNKYSKLDYIYFEKDASTKVFLIDKGKVKIGYYTSEGEEVIKAILCKGELFGEKAILGEEERTEFAQSIDNSTSICPIGVDTLHDLMRENQTFTLKIINVR